MPNMQRIIDMIRTGAYPARQITPLIEQDASTLVEAVVTSRQPATVRGHVVDYVRAVYTGVAAILEREVRLRTTAALDAADATARYEAQRAEAIGLVRELLDGDFGECYPDDLTAEQWAAIDRAPVYVARALTRGHTVERALSDLAARDAQIEALKAKVAQS